MSESESGINTQKPNFEPAAQQSAAVSDTKSPYTLKKVPHKSFIEKGSNQLQSNMEPSLPSFLPELSPEKPSSVTLLKMRKALSEKDSIISSHRLLVSHLYFYIQSQEQSIQLMRNVVSALKESLKRNGVPLPEIKDKGFVRSEQSKGSLSEATALLDKETVLKAAGVISSFKETDQVISPNLLSEYDNFFAERVNLTNLQPYTDTRSQALRTRARQDARPKYRMAKSKQHKKSEYGLNISGSQPKTDLLTNTQYGIRMQHLSPISPEYSSKRLNSKKNLGTERQQLATKKLKNMIQGGELVSEIIEAHMRSEDMHIIY